MRTPIIFLFLLVPACSMPSDTSPSLLPRPIESVSFAEPKRPVRPVEHDPTLEAEMSKRVRAFEVASGAFARTATDAGAAAARAAGAAVGSDAWIAAQTRISELSDARGSSESALVDLEQLAIARSTSGEPPYPALDAAIARANEESDRINARFTAIKARVKAP